MEKHNVTIYTTPTCHFCVKAKELFKQNRVAYKEIDVSKDKEKAKEMFEKSGQLGVPVIDIDGKIIIGYDKDRILKLLGL